MTKKRLPSLAILGTLALLTGAIFPWAGMNPFHDAVAPSRFLERDRAGHPSTTDALLTVTITPEGGTILSGKSTQFSAQASSNTAVISGISYSWALGPDPPGSLTISSGATTTILASQVALPTTTSLTVTASGYDVSAQFLLVTATDTVQVEVIPTLVAGPLSTTPDPATPGSEVTLAVETSGGLPPLTATWNFGDGTIATEGAPQDGLLHVAHVYHEGVYTPSLLVTDSSGGSSTSSSLTSLVVTNALAVALSAPGVGDVGEPTTVEASVSGGDPPYSFAWSASSGQRSFAANDWVLSLNAPGPLSLAVTVTDALGQTAAATPIIITVEPPPLLKLSSKPSTADEGTPFLLTVGISGGTSPYQVSWSATLEGAIFSSTFATQGSYLTPYAFSIPGEVVISASLTDAEGMSANVDERVGTVLPLPTVNLLLSPATPTVGAPLSLSGNVDGGLPPYNYSFTFSGPVTSASPSSGTMPESGLVTWSGSLSSPSPAIATVSVWDSSGGEAMVSIPISAVAMLRSSIVLSPLRGEVGRPLTADVFVTGGSPPYLLSLSGSDGESIGEIFPSAGEHSLPLVPLLAGDLSFTISVSDSHERGSTSQAQVEVAPPLGAYLGWRPSTVDAGEPLDVSLTPTGGWAPYFGTLTSSSGEVLFVNGITGKTDLILPLPSSGSFSLTFLLTDALGATASRTASVAVNPSPTVRFTASPTKTEVGVPVTFSLSAIGGTPPFSSVMCFGDGGMAHQQNVEHSYLTPGTYFANATLRDGTGAVDYSSLLSIEVVPDPLVLATVLVPSADVGLGVSFGSEASYGLPPYTYRWGFGDGSASTEADPTHAFATVGLYHVTLTVTDALGRIGASPPLNLTVESLPALSLSTNTTHAEVGESILLHGTPFGGSSPVTIIWNLGDGSEAIGSTISHIYSSPGSYTVTATLTDMAGGSALTTITLMVSAALSSTLVFTGSLFTEVGTMVSLSENPIGGVIPYTLSWSLGWFHASGTDLTTWPITPTTPGLFTGIVNVTDATGATVETSFTLNVAGSLSLNVSTIPALAEVGVPLTFEATISGGIGPYDFQWGLPDGETKDGNLSLLTLSPSAPGELTLSVMVTDALGRMASTSLSVDVTPRLTILFPPGPIEADAGLPFSLPLTVSGGVGTPPLSVSTPLGRNENATSLLFSTPGSYPIVVTAIDEDGGEAMAYANVTVSEPLTASFAKAPELVATGIPTEYAVTLSGGSGLLEETWSSPGFTSGVGDVANVTFLEPGRYSITFSVSDGAGATKSLNSNVTAINDTIGITLSSVASIGTSPFAPRVSMNVSGGRSPIDISLYLNGETLADITGVTTEVVWTGEPILSRPGSYQLLAVATDAIGARANTSLTLNACPPLLPPNLFPENPVTMAGTPLTLALDPKEGGCGGADVKVVWWGPGLLYQAGNTSIFLLNASRTVVDHVATLLQLPNGEVLENLTVPVVVSVRPGEALRATMIGPEMIEAVGENVTLSFEALDAYGNRNTTYNGSIELLSQRAEVGPHIAYFASGMARLVWSETRAGEENLTVLSSLETAKEVSVRWVANAERILLKIAYLEVSGSDLYINVSVTDVYGNPLSQVPVEAVTPGSSPVWANATGGWATFVLHGGAHASTVSIIGPGGALSTLNLGSGGSEAGANTLFTTLGFLFLAAVLTLSFLWWRRHGKPHRSPAERAAQVLSTLLKEWPGEDRESLLSMAEEEKVGHEEAQAALATLEKNGEAEHLTDEDGVERWRLRLRGEEGPDSPSPPDTPPAISTKEAKQ